MQINAKIDVTDAVLKLRNGEKRLAFGVQEGINDTLKTIQQAEDEHVAGIFTIRKAPFFFGTPGRPGGAAARITTFASARKNKAFGEIQAGIGGRKSGGQVLLPMFETGGARPLGTVGAKAAAVPITGGPARPSQTTSVPDDWTIKRLKLRRAPAPEGKRRRRLKAGEKPKLVGAHDTFLVRKSSGLPFGGIIERVSKDETKLVYKFVADEHLDDRLGWMPIAEQVATEFLDVNIARHLELSLAAEGLGPTGGKVAA